MGFSTEYTQSGYCRFLAYIPSWLKNQPWLVRVGGACPPPLSLSPSRTKLQCTLLLRGQIHSLYFLSIPYSTLWDSPPKSCLVIFLRVNFRIFLNDFKISKNWDRFYTDSQLLWRQSFKVILAVFETIKPKWLRFVFLLYSCERFSVSIIIAVLYWTYMCTLLYRKYTTKRVQCTRVRIVHTHSTVHIHWDG